MYYCHHSTDEKNKAKQLSNLVNTIQLTNGRAGMRIQTVWIQNVYP